MSVYEAISCVKCKGKLRIPSNAESELIYTTVHSTHHTGMFEDWISMFISVEVNGFI